MVDCVIFCACKRQMNACASSAQSSTLTILEDQINYSRLQYQCTHSGDAQVLQARGKAPGSVAVAQQVDAQHNTMGNNAARNFVKTFLKLTSPVKLRTIKCTSLFAFFPTGFNPQFE